MIAPGRGGVARNADAACPPGTPADAMHSHGSPARPAVGSAACGEPVERAVALRLLPDVRELVLDQPQTSVSPRVEAVGGEEDVRARGNGGGPEKRGYALGLSTGMEPDR